MHKDKAFLQSYSIKYGIENLKSQEPVSLTKVRCDRNGVVQISSSEGILIRSGGQFLFPGELVQDLSYRPMLDKKIKDFSLYQDQFVYADDKAILCNAWAGKLYSLHAMPDLKLFCGGADFSFLLTNGASIQYLRGSKRSPALQTNDEVIDIQFDGEKNAFWALGKHSVSLFDPSKGNLERKFRGDGFTCMALTSHHELVIGTHNGYFKINAETGKPIGGFRRFLPCNDLTVVKEIDQRLWFGSADGAFMLQPDGKFKYYHSKRWLPADYVKDISAGSNHSVLILTPVGLGEICFSPMTLSDKAAYFERQVRARHIRLGFNASTSGMKNGDVTTGSLEDSDNDGLWTSMYLGAEVFRYAVTKSPEALQNCRESLDAMERLYTINSQKGFPSRSFERRGYEISDVNTKSEIDSGLTQEYTGNAGVQPPFEVWRHADDLHWVWKSTTSSDEAIGHFFVFGEIAELIEEPELKNKAIRLMDALMQHIVDHDMYLVDWDGKPTEWGRWNPAYVNARPKMVGDRKITSSNIISMLQTAYHFTGKKIYKEKAFELLYKYGYLENLMRPMKEIGHAPPDADSLSRDLSESWNHSDDEMYFLGYWGLYRYAFNDTLKTRFRSAILDHWQMERPEKEAAWDIFTALTGVRHFDLEEAVWYLQKYPLDLVDWKITNSDRKDIRFIPPNFRRQTISEALPPDELPINRHNSNLFDLDGGNEKGNAEYSAGDIWLLPYWMGRYLKVIGGPAEKKSLSGYSYKKTGRTNVPADAYYKDTRFEQPYCIKYHIPDSSLRPVKILSDRNGNIKMLASNTILIPRAGKLLVPGELVRDVSYRPIRDMKISGIGLYENEFVYNAGINLFSNAWAGKLWVAHHTEGANLIEAGTGFDFLLAKGKKIQWIQGENAIWSEEVADSLIQIQFDDRNKLFWLLSNKMLYVFSPEEKAISKVFPGGGFTCLKILTNRILIGTHNGYIELVDPLREKHAILFDRLPCDDITVIREIDGDIWFGSSNGAFMQHKNGRFDYFASGRWLPDNQVIDMAKGNRHTVLVLTSTGFSQIGRQEMTLEEKAGYYEAIARQRHIRYGFYCDYTNLKKGKIATAQMVPHDSDNLWTSMYLSAELFRYLATHDQEAKKNCTESIDAMERLFTLSGIKGLFGRCIERRGAVEFKNEIREENKDYWYPGYDSVPSSWKHSSDSEWDWRGSASSDQAVGQYFALTMIAQYMDDPKLKKKAISLIDELTNYILENDLKIIDFDGRPTLWGRWSPDYVNRFPDMVGDKKLYSSNIISFLQIAFHFTGKEKYRAKAWELLYREKYLENLTRPVREIGPAPVTADKWSRLMSGSWNCSDDEMYFLAYWGLYPYALSDSLRAKYKEAIRDHWDLIRPEKEGLWNLCYAAIAGAKKFDLDGTIWELQRMPLDLINWTIRNSDRKDLELIKENQFERPTAEPLPPDERPENKHNRNLFKLDDEGGGSAELGGGDVYLLPYWMARYFGIISGSLHPSETPERTIPFVVFEY